MKAHKVLDRENQRIVSNLDARDTKLKITTKTLGQTRPTTEQYVFNEEQYLSMIETLGFLNEKAEKEVMNLNKITKMSREETMRIEQKARAMKTHMVVPNLLLTEYREDVINVTERYEAGIGKMKQLITGKKSSLATIASKIFEIKTINRELTEKIQNIENANLDVNIHSFKRVSDEEKKQLYMDFEQLLLNEKQKHAIFNRRLESLELEHASMDNKLVFLEDEYKKEKTEIQSTNKQRIENTSTKKRTKEELANLENQIKNCNEEIASLLSHVRMSQEYVQDAGPRKQRLENQITNLIKDINDLKSQNSTTAETMLKAQIESYKPKVADVKSQTSTMVLEIKNLDNIIQDIKDNTKMKGDEIRIYMDDISKLEDKKSLTIEEIERIRREIRELKKDLNQIDPVYQEISDIISENKNRELDLLDKFNQKKDQFRINFQTAKVCLGDKLKSFDLQLSTLKKLIVEQLAKRGDKEVLLNKVTKQPDFDWKKLSTIVELKAKISKLKSSIMSLKSGDPQSANESLKTTSAELENNKTRLLEEIQSLKRNAVTFESEHRVTYDVKTFDYDTKLKEIRELIAKRKQNVTKLEAVLSSVSNTSVLLNPEKTTMESKLEQTYKRHIDFQSKEIEDLKAALNEYSN